MNPFTLTTPLTRLSQSTTPTNEGWATFVKSAESAISDMGDARYMLIALGIAVVLWINLRLARWLSASIKFDPPHHEATRHETTKHPRAH